VRGALTALIARLVGYELFLWLEANSWVWLIVIPIALFVIAVWVIAATSANAAAAAAFHGARSKELPEVDTARSGAENVELVYWQSIVDSSDPADFRAYMEQYPRGVFVSLARNRVEALAGGQASSQPHPQ